MMMHNNMFFNDFDNDDNDDDDDEDLIYNMMNEYE